MLRTSGLLPVLLLLGLPAAGQEEGEWAFSATAFGYFVPATTSCSPCSPRTGALCTSRPATTTRRRTQARSGSEGTSPEARISSGRSRRWSGGFSGTLKASPRVTRVARVEKARALQRGEYVFDTTDTSASFFYNWSELTYSPLEWFRFGLVTQRTRNYASDREIQRGLLAGFSYKALYVAGYVFNPDDEGRTIIVGVTLVY